MTAGEVTIVALVAGGAAIVAVAAVTLIVAMLDKPKRRR